MTKIRQDFTIEKANILLLQKVVKESQRIGKKVTMSGIINELISKNLQNPIDRLKEENKELAIRINSNQDRIKLLEKIKEEQT
jgi:hypothetical protein